MLKTITLYHENVAEKVSLKTLNLYLYFFFLLFIIHEVVVFCMEIDVSLKQFRF